MGYYLMTDRDRVIADTRKTKEFDVIRAVARHYFIKEELQLSDEILLKKWLLVTNNKQPLESFHPDKIKDHLFWLRLAIKEVYPD